MPSFSYEALAADGGARAGTIEADTLAAAQAALESGGLLPVRIGPSHGAGGAGARVPRAQVLAFTRSLGSLLSAGVPLSRALTVIERETAHRGARAAWGDVHARVRDGSPLADALAAQGGAFAPVFIAMVRAGEAGGFLSEVLGQVADYLERSRELGGRVVSALVYPCLLALIAGGVVCFLLVWFIPRFATLFASFHQQLPPLTRAIQAASAALTAWGWLAALAAAGAVLLGRHLLRRPAGAAAADRLLLALPGVAGIRAGAARARFCRMLGTLLRAGVPVLTGLRVARSAVGSPAIELALDHAAERVRQGDQLTAALAGAGALLPPAARESLAVAESSGRLAEELLRQAEASERELDRRLRTLVALAEPLLLMLMAALVGTIVVGMLLPIFDLWSAIT